MSRIILRFGLCFAFCFAACGKSTPPADPSKKPPSGSACIKTGCSGTVCAEQDVITTCEYKPEYACYKTATCERQADGKCGWTQTAELTACLANPPPM